MVSDEWVNRLAEVMARVIREMAVRLEGQMVVYLNISCFAWYGLIEISLLTTEELDQDPTLGTPDTVGIWQYYALYRVCNSWDKLEEIGKEIRSVYQAANEDTYDLVADKFVQICFTAAQSQVVESALKTLTRDSRFQVWVFHPDE